MKQEPKAPVVYIVDDDASVRRALTRVMKSCGLEAVACESARDLLGQLPAKGRCCVIADMRMPDMTGLDLQKELSDAGRAIPVILLTAHDTPEMREAAKTSGLAGYFRKPVDAQALIDAVRWALSS